MTQSPFIEIYSNVSSLLIGTKSYPYISECVGYAIATKNLGERISYEELLAHPNLIDPTVTLKAYLLKAAALGHVYNELYRVGEANFLETALKSYSERLQHESEDCREAMAATTYEFNPATDIREWLEASTQKGILDKALSLLEPTRKSVTALHEQALKEESDAQQGLQALTPILKLMMEENRLSIEAFQNAVALHAQVSTWGEISYDLGTILNFSYVS